jgi:crotonobetainyl-CoA:carnitine CoA-transferase CaiB-like acyl-CoA transferase
MRALEGIRVLDFGQYLAGPFGPMVLADLGADVVKVEPVTGDAMRFAAKPFVGCQRGKRGIALDLKSEDGLAVAHRLVETADVVHHNMTKGTAGRLGLDYGTLRAVNPALIYCNTYAYGKEGPLSHFGGLDPLYQAALGLEHEAGAVPEGNPPLYYRFGMCDTANALASVQAVLMALYHRRRTGQGQDVTTSLLSASALFASEFFRLPSGEPRPRRPRLDKEQTGTAPLYRLYETREGWLQLAAVTDEQWRALVGVLGLDGDQPPRADELAECFLRDTARTWSLRLADAGVPAEVSVDTGEGEAVLFDDDNVRLGLVAEYEHPLLGRMRQFGNLIGFSDTPGAPQGPPPMRGQHTREVLAEAGYSGDEITDLLGRGVAAEPEDGYMWAV